jgi:hypothetical protein
LRNFASKIGKTQKSGDHRQEDLAKSGYKSDTTYKYLIALLYFWLQTENQINKSGFLKTFFPHFCAKKTLENHFIFQILTFNYNNSSQKNNTTL